MITAHKGRAMATMPHDTGRRMSTREIVTIAGFAVLGATVALVEAFGPLA
jgi:hypothetical protein